MYLHSFQSLASWDQSFAGALENFKFPNCDNDYVRNFEGESCKTPLFREIPEIFRWYHTLVFKKPFGRKTMLQRMMCSGTPFTSLWWEWQIPTTSVWTSKFPSWGPESTLAKRIAWKELPCTVCLSVAATVKTKSARTRLKCVAFFWKKWTMKAWEPSTRFARSNFYLSTSLKLTLVF